MFTKHDLNGNATNLRASFWHPPTRLDSTRNLVMIHHIVIKRVGGK